VLNYIKGYENKDCHEAEDYQATTSTKTRAATKEEEDDHDFKRGCITKTNV